MSRLQRTRGRHTHDGKSNEDGDNSGDEEQQYRRRGGRGRPLKPDTSEEKTSLLQEEKSRETHIHESDILKFVRVYVPNDPKHDYSDMFLKSAEYTPRRDKRVVFVENAKHGQFIPIYLPVQDAHALMQTSAQASEHNSADVDEEVTLRTTSATINQQRHSFSLIHVLPTLNDARLHCFTT